MNVDRFTGVIARVFSMVAMVTPLAHAADVPKAPVPKSPYLPIIYRYADTMLERGRDNYGPQKTGLFLSALDRTRLAPLTNRPPAPSGVREEDRVGAKDGPLAGANPWHDENLLRLLYTLSELSGKAHYRQAADAELKWLLENARTVKTASSPWSPLMSWNVMTDQAAPTDQSSTAFFRPWLLWDRCFELTPEASKRFTLLPWQDERIRDNKVTPGPMDLPRGSGFCIRTWAVGYAHTKDEAFLKRIEALLSRLEKPDPSQARVNEPFANNEHTVVACALSTGIDCDGAAHRVPHALAARLRQWASREDALFLSLPHDLKRGGFVTALDKATGRPNGKTTSLWSARDGGNTTAQVGMMCVSRYDNTGKVGYRDLILAAADAYRISRPADDEDAWPLSFGHAISLQIAAWRHSAQPAYLEGARRIADLAVEKFWGANTLPKASFKTDHYEAITGADTLALALVELHLNILHITAVRCPPNTIDR